MTLHVIVCDSENYMENRLGIIFLENLISVARLNVVGINFQGQLNGGGSNGGFPDLGLSFLFCPFLDFPDFSGIFPICPGIFPICPFSAFLAI